LSNDLRFVRRFQISAVVIIAFVIAGILVNFHIKTEKLTEDILLQQARALFDQMVLTRRWLSDHGGVYVQVKPPTEPSSFLLRIPGLKVNIKDEDGVAYTLRNPGIAVREISELGKKTSNYSFHVSSLKPINPKNTPDAFEEKALKSFEKGEKEAMAIEQSEEGPVYRYMAPLYYEEQCNSCHASQGYKLGDIRGGISVSIPMALVNQQLRNSRIYTAISAFFVLGLLFGALYILSKRFMRLLNDAQNKLVLMAATDGLTGLLNRSSGINRLEEEISRHHRSGLPLSCLMLDIDHFKSINDTYGHLAGDAVLVSIASALKKCTRKYDTVCRYGGEEFMILLPEAGLWSAVAVADQMRETISKNTITFKGESIAVTASVGVSQMDTSKIETADSIIYRADNALYMAKAEGRNRVCMADEKSNLNKPSA